MRNIIKLLLLLFIFIFPSICFSHPGSLNKDGCHNSKKHGYHCHSKKEVKEEKQTISDEERSKRINEYFRKANENVGALDPSIVKTERLLDEKSRREILKRDHYKCVICGSNHKLEVDHKRALQNGGSNDSSNLATLCKKCHIEKTKMDNSLRRKREKIKKEK